MIRSRSVLLVCILALFFAVPVYADSSLSQIIVFGDSNTDTGANDEGSLYDLSGGDFNGPPNAEGRNCNGPVVVEYAADMLEVPLVNYSVSGATTGEMNLLAIWYAGTYPQVVYTGVLSQMEMFEEDLDGGFADHRALYVYWAGSNDIYGATAEDVVPRTAAALDNIENALTRLTELGARNILVATRATRPDFSTENNINGVIFNAALRTHIMALDGELRSNIQIYEAFDFITDMMFYPADYGFTEPTELCATDPDCSIDLDIAAEYVQWDGAHKTTRVHEVMAQKMVQQVKSMRTGNKKGPKKIK
jgi:phospholipase/lecithinase/hemolysin